MKERFNELWTERDNADSTEERQKIESEMAALLERYQLENYPNIDDPEVLVPALKRDFESDLLPAVVADALDVSVEWARRFRYTRDRGVIDGHVGERKSIPPSVREEVEERDGGVCVRCRDPDPDLALHHIIPKSHGGVDHMDNMAMLCEMCHEDAHCGDYNSGRLAYNDKEAFWTEFCGYDEVPIDQA